MSPSVNPKGSFYFQRSARSITVPDVRVRVKICGITNAEDALAAVNSGADALGFMFFEGSKRNVSFARATEIMRELPPFIAKVGVFVNATEDFIQRAQETGIDTLQFHGDETPEFCARFAPAQVVKAFRVRGHETLRHCQTYPGHAWLLDSYVAGEQGGTGATFDWDLAAEATKLNPRVILAGGLKPFTVAAAVKKVQPYAVDVSSGVESAPGRKDHGKIRAFIAAAKG
jgi:phosphoribosylanthranilate isomerase